MNGLQANDGHQVLQVPVADVLSFQTELNQEIGRIGELRGDDVLPKSALLDISPEGIPLSRACGTETQEDLSDESSVHTLDSIFSNLTASTVSSVGTKPEPSENLYSLLTWDDLRILYSRILDFTSTKDFEGALRQILTRFASSLRKEASDDKQRGVAQIVKYRA